MSKAIVFTLGAAAGAVGGVAVTLALAGQGAPASPGLGAVPAPAATPPSEVHDPGRALPGDPAPSNPAAAPTTTPATPAAPAPAVDTNPAAPQATGDDEQAARTALEEAQARAGGKPRTKAEAWRTRARSLHDWDPESAAHRALFDLALTDLAGDDPAAAEGAGYALAWAATQNRLSAEQLGALERLFPQLMSRYDTGTPTFRRHFYRGVQLDPPIDETDPAAWTAWIIASGLQQDPAKLAEFIRQVPADRSPAIHLALLLAVGGRGDDLHRAYVTRLTKQATHARVLISAWDAGRIHRISNRQWATTQLDAFDERLSRGGLAPGVRAHGWRAVTNVGVLSPERGYQLLQRAAEGAERNRGLREFCGAAATLLKGGLIDGAAVQALAQKHPPTPE